MEFYKQIYSEKLFIKLEKEEPTEECPICYDKINQKVVKCDTCKHDFHFNCVKQWFDIGKESCPHCRRTWNFIRETQELQERPIRGYVDTVNTYHFPNLLEQNTQQNPRQNHPQWVSPWINPRQNHPQWVSPWANPRQN